MEWTWVARAGWRLRPAGSGLSLSEFQQWPRYLGPEAVAALTSNGVNLLEYRRRIRRLSQVVRAQGGDTYDVNAYRKVLVTAAQAGVPFDDVVNAVADPDLQPETVEIMLRAGVPVWFANYCLYGDDTPVRPAPVRALYKRLTSYRGSSDALVQAIIEETGGHERIRPWAALRLPETVVRMLIKVGIGPEEVRATPALADPDGLALMVALRENAGLQLLRVA